MMISKCAVLSLVLCHSALVQCLFSSPHYSRELWRNPNSAASNGLPLCPSLPVASLSADQLLAKLQESLKQVDQEIQAALQEDKSPGGAVVSVVYGDGVIWSKGYGLKNMSDPKLGTPDENTRFRIGSISKVFTALQTLIMRDGGSITSLDDDIKKYYREFSIINPFQTERGITFRQLMSHMSGLPRNAPCQGIFDTGCNVSDAEMMRNIAGLSLMFPPGTQPAYSNLGFGLLGKVLTRVSIVPSWDDLLYRLVTQPLGMENTGNSFEHIDPDKLAVGYYPDGSVAKLIDIGWDASAGQCYSSTADLAKLMSLVFSDQKSSKEQLIDGETIREWLGQAYVYADGTGFSLPWELIPLGNYTLHTKDGVINGYNAEFQMAIITNITLLKFGGGQALFIIQGSSTAPLEWREKDSFQITVRGYPAVPCFALGSGYIGEWVYFKRSFGRVVSLTVPGMAYQEVYKKQ